MDLYWDCCSRYQNADDPYRALSWADMTIGTRTCIQTSSESMNACAPGLLRPHLLKHPSTSMHKMPFKTGVNLLLYELLGWDDFAGVIVKHHDNYIARIPHTPKGLKPHPLLASRQCLPNQRQCTTQPA